MSYGDGVYKTTDGGATWSNLGLKDTKYISRILIDPRNHNHVLVGAEGDVFADSTERGVYVTDDGGKSWRKTLYVGPMSGVSDMALDPHDPNIVYAGIWQFRRYPWTFQSGGPDDGLYKSTDGGNTWNKLSGHGLPTDTLGRIGDLGSTEQRQSSLRLDRIEPGALMALERRRRKLDDGKRRYARQSTTVLFYAYRNRPEEPGSPIRSLGGAFRFQKTASGTFARLDDRRRRTPSTVDRSRRLLSDDRRGRRAIFVDSGPRGDVVRVADLPIGQTYRVGLSRENPYWVCAGFQDSPSWCAPSR